MALPYPLNVMRRSAPAVRSFAVIALVALATGCAESGGAPVLPSETAAQAEPEAPPARTAAEARSELVRMGVEVSSYSLYEASCYGSVETVELLLDTGFDPDADGDGSYLSNAARCSRLDVVEVLFDRGANPNAYATVPPLSEAVEQAHASGDTRLVQALLERGADPNARNTRNGVTPLMLAADWTDEPLARLLTEHGGDPTKPDHGSRSALDYAALRVRNRGTAETRRVLAVLLEEAYGAEEHYLEDPHGSLLVTLLSGPLTAAYTEAAWRRGEVYRPRSAVEGAIAPGTAVHVLNRERTTIRLGNTNSATISTCHVIVVEVGSAGMTGWVPCTWVHAF